MFLVQAVERRLFHCVQRILTKKRLLEVAHRASCSEFVVRRFAIVSLILVSLFVLSWSPSTAVGIVGDMDGLFSSFGLGGLDACL